MSGTAFVFSLDGPLEETRFLGGGVIFLSAVQSERDAGLVGQQRCVFSGP